MRKGEEKMVQGGVWRNLDENKQRGCVGGGRTAPKGQGNKLEKSQTALSKNAHTICGGEKIEERVSSQKTPRSGKLGREDKTSRIWAASAQKGGGQGTSRGSHTRVGSLGAGGKKGTVHQWPPQGCPSKKNEKASEKPRRAKRENGGEGGNQGTKTKQRDKSGGS